MRFTISNLARLAKTAKAAHVARADSAARFVRRKALVLAVALLTASGVTCHGPEPRARAAAPLAVLAAAVPATPLGIAPAVFEGPPPPSATSNSLHGEIRTGDRPRDTLQLFPPGTPFPAREYAALDGAACLAQLAERHVPFVKVAKARGVDRPIRFTGPLHGVDFHGEPTRDRRKSPYEILDCRLALALDDLSTRLAAHGIVEAVHMSMYRPPTGAFDSRRKRIQHEAGLAIDLGALVRADGTRLVVDEDWHGRLGARTCGEGAAPTTPTPSAVELRSILCDTVEARTFQLFLTPNYNPPHHNHFHLEIVRGVKWFMVD